MTRSLYEDTPFTRLAGHGRQIRGLQRRPPGNAKAGFEILVTDATDVLATGDMQGWMFVPEYANGMRLMSAHACVTTPSTSGLPTVQIRNVTDAVDMLATRITIDENDRTSYAADTPHEVDTANDEVATGNLLAVDVDVAGTGAKGLVVILVFG